MNVYLYSLPDVLTNELVSLNLLGTADKRSILLLDQTESLVFFSDAAFCERIGCDPAASIKVVSIIGCRIKFNFFLHNTGSGKPVGTGILF
jgi:hypothetical protein